MECVVTNNNFMYTSYDGKRIVLMIRSIKGTYGICYYPPLLKYDILLLFAIKNYSTEIRDNNTNYKDTMQIS